MTKQHRLGQRVLEILEAEPDWSPGTLDDISGAAFDLGLAEMTEDGLFKTKAPPDTLDAIAEEAFEKGHPVLFKSQAKEPATPAVATPETLITYKAVRTEYFPASYTLVAKDGDGNRVKYRRTDAKVECDHYAAAVALITKHWTNSPEVLDRTRYHIQGGWLAPAVYVWVVIDVREERR